MEHLDCGSFASARATRDKDKPIFLKPQAVLRNLCEIGQFFEDLRYKTTKSGDTAASFTRRVEF